ncbi:MAG TPA: FG-GAP-like repeat-containing protein [Leptospiraceae bacterium]|nr:FG-GAP-like repeat-containing protein [Leptospiraceae bacterium]HMW04207.1 FG-GAP-like repeat-containing protein [Leptospiraceae bacterium]HMX32739.1 FG-GAP-like repeat-containing protein [Leptospiraceae bacterium]HMY30200.1 FG-GAP-like repeat-containing protein [Leptospiraceae bacterium]HMZ67306.1 FG-GAP-like repeat-containing protein [Leptospiraceae bacterium]
MIKKYIILLFISVSLVQCLEVKKSPFDLSSPNLFTIGLFIFLNNSSTSGDRTAPTLTVTNLKSKMTIEFGAILGTASDNVSVSKVEVQLNNGNYSLATGTTSWSYKLPLTGWLTGNQNTINVRVTDSSGNTTINPYTLLTKGQNKDVNGDGYLDLIVSAPNYNSNQGRVYVFHGSASGISSATASSASKIYTGFNVNLFGKNLALGDFNQDGYSDLFICSSLNGNANNRGDLYLGSATGLANTATTYLPPSGTNTEYCSSVQPGDFNGDGYTDLVVSDIGYSNPPNNGYLYIYYGSQNGLSTSVGTTLVSGAGSNLGIGMSVGDINGDGYADIVATNSGSATVYLFFGAAAGVSTLTTAFNGTGVSASGFPYLMDINGDYKADFLSSNTSFNSNVGRVGVFQSTGASFNSTPVFTIDGDGPNYLFANFITSADTNGDGTLDIVFGNPSGNHPNGNQGAVYVIQCAVGATCAGSGTASSLASLKITGGATQDFFGSFVTFRDVNRDGYLDLIAAARGYNSGTNQGALYIFNGTATAFSNSTVSANSKMITGESAANSFGNSGF